MADEDVTGENVEELHHVQVLIDGELYYEDHNVVAGRILHTRFSCDAHGDVPVTHHVWRIEAQTLTDLDMNGTPLDDEDDDG